MLFRSMSLDVAEGCWVKLRYRIRDAQGEEIESGERELTYLHGGFGAVLQGIEDAIEGQQAGFATTVHLEPEDAFGDYDADLVHLAPRESFPENLEPGMGFQGIPGQEDDGRVYIATEFTDDTVVLDGNHPLAGIAIRLHLRVQGVREATEDEIGRGSAGTGFFRVQPSAPGNDLLH